MVNVFCCFGRLSFYVVDIWLIVLGVVVDCIRVSGFSVLVFCRCLGVRCVYCIVMVRFWWLRIFCSVRMLFLVIMKWLVKVWCRVCVI